MPPLLPPLGRWLAAVRRTGARLRGDLRADFAAVDRLDDFSRDLFDKLLATAAGLLSARGRGSRSRASCVAFDAFS